MNPFFATRVDVTESGCWEWKLYRCSQGYGKARDPQAKKTTNAHRLSYKMHVGPIPDGLTVDHLCFNPPCVNPAHLRLLTPSKNSENQRDAYKTHCIRGHEFTAENTLVVTSWRGRRKCRTCHRERERAAYHTRPRELRGRARGERNGQARLTAADVVSMRALSAAGTSGSEIARRFGIGRSTVTDVLSGRNWQHVTGGAA